MTRAELTNAIDDAHTRAEQARADGDTVEALRQLERASVFTRDLLRLRGIPARELAGPVIRRSALDDLLDQLR